MIAYFDITSMDKMLIKIVFREEALGIAKSISFKMRNTKMCHGLQFYIWKPVRKVFLFFGFLVLHNFCLFVVKMNPIDAKTIYSFYVQLKDF